MAAVLSLTACGGDDSPSARSNTAASPPRILPSSPNGQVIQSNVSYGRGATVSGNVRLRFDIYQPSDTCNANRPTVLFIHGGGFTSGDKAEEPFIPALANAMNRRDINFVSINYRLDRDDPVPSAEYVAVVDDLLASGAIASREPLRDAIAAAIEDTVVALRFLENNGDNFCVDTSRLAYWGASAGAYVALQVGYGLNQFGIDRPDPLVVVDYWGDLFRKSDLEAGEAPFLIVHGTNDTTVPFAAADGLADRADRVGVNYAFYSVTGGGHGFGGTGLFSNTIGGDTLAQVSADFVAEHLNGGSPVYRRASVTAQ